MRASNHQCIHLSGFAALLQLERPDVNPPEEKIGRWVPAKDTYMISSENSSWLEAPLMTCIRGKTSFLRKGTFGGLSRWWFSSDGGLVDGVTVYTAGSPVKVERKSGAWKMSLEYSDILSHRWFWKGTNRERKKRKLRLHNFTVSVLLIFILVFLLI